MDVDVGIKAIEGVNVGIEAISGFLWQSRKDWRNTRK